MGVRDWFTKKQQEGIEDAAELVDNAEGFKIDRNAPKVAGCAACENNIPIMVNKKGERKHFDFFATPEFGAFYNCPCEYGEEEKDEATVV